MQDPVRHLIVDGLVGTYVPCRFAQIVFAMDTYPQDKRDAYNKFWSVPLFHWDWPDKQEDLWVLLNHLGAGAPLNHLAAGAPLNPEGSVEYWETWERVLQNASFTDHTGQEWVLEEGDAGDVFAVHKPA